MMPARLLAPNIPAVAVRGERDSWSEMAGCATAAGDHAPIAEHIPKPRFGLERSPVIKRIHRYQPATDSESVIGIFELLPDGTVRAEYPNAEQTGFDRSIED